MVIAVCRVAPAHAIPDRDKDGGSGAGDENWHCPTRYYRLRLYIAGQTPNSIAAIDNLKKICEDKLRGKYRIEVVDLLEKPQLAKGDQIIAIPTLDQ
jgi:circadian clock protein KaiB